jgi:hypothetical protein
MNYKQLKKKVKELEVRNNTNKGLKTHYKELFETAISELKFKNMQVEILLKELDQIDSFTTDKLVKQVIQLIKTRHVLDISINYRNYNKEITGFNK